MKKMFIACSLCILVLAACDATDEAQHKRATQLAKDYCDCFSSLEGKISPNLMKLYNVDYSDTLQLDDLVKKLTDEEIQEHQKLAAAIQDETKPLGKCVKLADFHSLYASPHENDKNSVYHVVVMHQTPDCRLASRYVYGGIGRVSNAMKRQGL